MGTHVRIKDFKIKKKKITYMHSISFEMPGWMNHKLESRLPRRNINNLRYAADTTLMAESKEELKSFFYLFIYLFIYF